MKRYSIIFSMLALCLTSTPARAQERQSDPQELKRAAEVLRQLVEARSRLAQNVPAPPDLPALDGVIRYYNPQRSGAPGGRGAAPDAPVFFRRTVTITPGGAWWTNTALIAQLGLTDDQKSKIERAYDNHRVNLATATEQLNKEESQLAKLLEADSIDRNAILAQIDRVNQARGEMERQNSVMTLEMREALTRAQWVQLEASQPVATWVPVGNKPNLFPNLVGPSPAVPVTPGLRGGGGRGQRQQ